MKCERCERIIDDKRDPFTVKGHFGYIRLFLCKDCYIQATASVKEILSIFMRKRVELTPYNADEIARDSDEEQ